MHTMLEQHYQRKLDDAFGFMFEPELMQEIIRIGQARTFREGDLMMDIGQAITHLPLLLEGAVKIMREDSQGDELLLYYLERGDTCAMSFSCCMSTKKSRVRATVEEDSEMVLVPLAYLDKWLGDFPTWKAYVFQSIDARMNEFLESIDSLAFLRMDERLAKYLRNKVMVTGSMEIRTTHQEIAIDLHTSRVVVSRLLKQLEKEGLVQLSRNLITVRTMDLAR
ncbi:MAG: Crp/Fnr family transcriptional regulator [Bacteroidota bacterium]